MAGSGLLLDEVDRRRCAGRARDCHVARATLRRSRARHCAGDRRIVIHGSDHCALVWDLDHKERFLRVVFTPQSKSWLARGAFILIAYSGLCGVFWLAAAARIAGHCLRFVVAHRACRILRGGLHGISFRTMRRPRSVANAASPGPFDRASAALRIGGAGVASGRDWRFGAGARVRSSVLVVSLILHLVMLLGEVAMPHTTDNGRYGARLMTHGPFARAFWGGAVVVGGIDSAGAPVDWRADDGRTESYRGGRG